MTSIDLWTRYYPVMYTQCVYYKGHDLCIELLWFRIGKPISALLREAVYDDQYRPTQ